MMRLLILISIFYTQSISGQSAADLVKKSYSQFQKLASYSSDISFKFDIPTVNIKNLNGKVYYKSPDKYRVKVDGIAFIPNENPMKIYSYLGDKTKYNVLLNSTETVNGMKCHVINIIPNGEADFILGKLWLSQTNNCPYKVELTTRRGTVKMENYFKTMLTYGLPDKVIFYLENFKAPKGKGLGPKKETKEEKIGTITMLYTNYQINTPIADSFFPKKIIEKTSNK
jgi:outer membrane lipoprotein-sorting protein